MPAINACRSATNALIPACRNRMQKLGRIVSKCSGFAQMYVTLPYRPCPWITRNPNTSVTSAGPSAMLVPRNALCLKTITASSALQSATSVPMHVPICRGRKELLTKCYEDAGRSDRRFIYYPHFRVYPFIAASQSMVPGWQ